MALVLAMPLTVASRRFVDEAALKALPPRAILVNVSRGGLVDEEALTAALVSGEIAGAILDTCRRAAHREPALEHAERDGNPPHGGGRACERSRGDLRTEPDGIRFGAHPRARRRCLSRLLSGARV